MNTQQIITRSRFCLLALFAISVCWLPVIASAQTMVFDVDIAGRGQIFFNGGEVRVFGDIRLDPSTDFPFDNFSVDNLEANLFFVHRDDPPVTLPSRAFDVGSPSNFTEVLQWSVFGDDLYLGLSPNSDLADSYIDETLLFRERGPQGELWEISFGSFFDFEANRHVPNVSLFFSSNASIPQPAVRSSFTLPVSAGNFIKVGTLRPTLLGDTNLDGVVDFLDINPFIELLASNTYLAQADCNEDGVLNFLDIAPFITILAGN